MKKALHSRAKTAPATSQPPPPPPPGPPPPPEQLGEREELRRLSSQQLVSARARGGFSAALNDALRERQGLEPRMPRPERPVHPDILALREQRRVSGLDSAKRSRLNAIVGRGAVPTQMTK